MYRSYTLKPLTVHEQPLVFEWNPETGAIRGRDAARVIDLSVEAQRLGEVIGHPYPTAHQIKNPLLSLSDMAVVLGNDWILSDDLREAYPMLEQDELITEIDVNGVEHPTGFTPLN